MSNGDYKFFMERAVSHALAGNIAGMCRVAINRLRKNVPPTGNAHIQQHLETLHEHCQEMIDAGEIIRALYNGSGEVDDPKEFVQTYRQLSENFIAESQAVFNLLRDQIDQSSLANDPDVAKRIAMLEELLVKSHKLDEARTAIDKAWELVK